MASARPFIYFGFLFSVLPLCLLYSLEKGYAYGGGETTTERHHHHNHVVQINSLLPAPVCSTSTPKGDPEAYGKGRDIVNPIGLDSRTSLKVVHKHGPCSKLRKKKAESPHAEILLQDQSRVNFLQSTLSNATSQVQGSKAKLPTHTGSSLGSGNYILSVGFGTPKTDLSIIFDTGSDLTWIQCQPCVRYCYAQQDPIFDPSKSSSYSNITCNTAECSQLTAATGNSPGCSSSSSTCIYGIQYGDQSYSVGFFGRETLTFTPSDVFSNFQFGCGQNNRGLFGNTAGLLGLGRGNLSIVSQTAKKYGGIFSYCLPSTSSSTGYLAFGNERRISSVVKFTPLSVDSRGPSFYFLSLTAISVGGRKLRISASVFATAGTIIDSGTVITRLPPSAYSALRSSFRRLMSKYPSAPALSILDTCYNLTGYNTIMIPKIALYFSGRTKVDVDSSGILYAGSSTSQVCLAFAGNSDAGDLAILGNRQQQKLDIVYDVGKGRIGFGPGGCS